MGDWMAARLTGDFRSERSLAGDCGLLDVATRERDAALLDDLSVPPALLPPLVSPEDIAGEVTRAAAEATGLAAGTPVVIAGADTQCADFAMGVRERGEVGIVAGWSCPLQIVTSEPRIDSQRRTWTSVHVLPQRWVVESSTADAGRTWRWWCETLLGEHEGALEEGAALAAQAPPGSGNVAALLGPAAMNAGAWGIHLGGVLMTTPLTVSPVGRPELLRAALENIAFALRANLEQAQEVAGLDATRVVVGGGLTRSPVFPSILASVLGRAIDVASEPEASALGAAALAGRAAGLDDETLISPVARFEPDAGAAETYRHQYERWRKLGAALDATMKEL
jgi:autoinducer 2 (AI-2) kinase